MLLMKEAIKRQILHSMVEISKVEFLPRPIRNLELMEVDVSVKVKGYIKTLEKDCIWD